MKNPGCGLGFFLARSEVIDVRAGSLAAGLDL